MVKEGGEYWFNQLFNCDRSAGSRPKLVDVVFTIIFGKSTSYSRSPVSDCICSQGSTMAVEITIMSEHLRTDQRPVRLAGDTASIANLAHRPRPRPRQNAPRSEPRNHQSSPPDRAGRTLCSATGRDHRT